MCLGRGRLGQLCEAKCPWPLLNAFYVVFQEANSFHTPGAMVASSVSMTSHQQQVGNVVTSQTMPGILVTAPPPTVTFVQAFPTSLASAEQPYQVLPLNAICLVAWLLL